MSKKVKNSTGLFVIFGLLLVVLAYLIGKNQILSNIKPVATPAPTLVPTVTPTKTPVKTTTKTTTATTDPDPIVNCTKNSECGGGTTPVRKSVCDQSVCCQRLGKWIWYTDKGQCLNDQRADNQYNQAQQDRTAQEKEACEKRIIQSKTDCYQACHYWSDVDLTKYNDCLDGCDNLYNKYITSCD